MNARGQAISLLIASLIAGAVSYWLFQPCWQVTGYHFFRFAGKNEVSKELFSYACDLNQTQLTWETHDWRTGKLVRSLALDVPAKKDYIGVLDVPTSGETEDCILVLAERHRPTNGNLTSYLLDAATGKRLSDKPIDEWISTPYFIARHRSQLAISLKNELRLFRDKHDPGRRITLPRVKSISFSADGKTLACVGNNAQLTLIDFATGSVRGSKNITGHIDVAQFVSNDELMVFSSGLRGTGVTVTRWQLDESDCRQISQPVLLRWIR